jgi:hypothetical protein
MFPVWHAYSSNVWPVSTSRALIEVVSSRRSSMFIKIIPFFVTICFRLKVIDFSFVLSKNGMILMNMLERLLETTSINARDVETGQTLLEY